MSRITFGVEARADVELAEIASSFQDMDSVSQAIVLEELFDALKFGCKTNALFEMQLLHISNQIELKNFKNLKYVFETVNAFLETKEKGTL